MVRVTILYPAIPGKRFDFDYYLKVHMPMSIALLGPTMKAVGVERGVSPGAPWPDHTYVAMCTFTCESKEAYEQAFFPHAARLQGDMANYTDIAPVIQISEIVLAH